MLFANVPKPEHPLAWANLVLATISLLLVVILVIRRADKATQALLACVRKARTCFKQARSTDEALLLVRERLKRQTVQHVTIYNQLLCFLFVPLTLTMFRSSVRDDLEFETLLQEMLHGLTHATTLLIVLNPAVITERSIDAICSLPLLLSAASMWPISGQFQDRVIGRGTLLLITNIMARRTCRTRLWPIYGIAILLFELAVVFSVKRNMAEGHDFLGPVATWPLVAVVHMTGVLLLVLLSSVFDNAMEKILVNNMRLQDVQQLHSAANALLRSCCDVVVDLDSEGRIATPARDLGAFLLKDHCLRGLKLTDFFTDYEDIDAFYAKLFAPRQEEATMAETMQVTVKDGYSSTLRLELFWFQFRRLNGQLNYMAGLREFSDYGKRQECRSEGDMLRETEDSSQEETVRHNSNTPVWNLRARALEDGFAVPETSSSSTGSFARSAVQDTVPKVVLDCTQPAYPVRALSSGFCMRVGRLPRDAKLLEYMDDPDSFSAWLKMSLSSLKNGFGAPENQHVLLKMGHGRPAVAARCSLESPSEDEEEITVDMARIVVLFNDIYQKESHSMHGPKRVRGSRIRSCPPKIQHTSSLVSRAVVTL